MLTEDGCRSGAHPRAASAEESFFFEVFLTYRVLRAAFERTVGISQSRLMLLGLVFMAGEVSQSELQHRLDIDGAAITRQVKQLEAEGYLSRRPDPADNRFTLVALTPEGRQKLEDVQKKGHAFMASSAQGINPEELACVRRCLERVRSNVGGDPASRLV